VNALLLAAVALGDKIETFGAYFGYAAVIGLGVLSLLYFAQAKEVKRLREWAGRSPEREADLAQRAQADVQRRVVAQPIVPQPGVAATAGPQTPAAQQAEAARKAAAAAVLQKFQPPGGTAPGAPVVAPPGQLARPGGLGQPGGQPQPQPQPSPAASGAGTATPGAPAAPGTTPAPGAPTTVGPAPGPALPPSAANAGAVAAARQAAIAGRTASNGDAHDPLNPPISPTPLDVPPRQPREVTLTDRDSGRSPSRIGVIVGGVFTVLVIAIAIVLLLSAGGDDPTPKTAGTSSPPAASKPPPPAPGVKPVNRRATKIVVLNGTFQTGLAASVASKIEDKGFTILSKPTNADQQVATTTVSYASGNKPAALLVAKIVGVSAGAVKPADANASVAAGPDADVVVITGGDLASTG
jgi:hypothetical protein